MQDRYVHLKRGTDYLCFSRGRLVFASAGSLRVPHAESTVTRKFLPVALDRPEAVEFTGSLLSSRVAWRAPLRRLVRCGTKTASESPGVPVSRFSGSFQLGCPPLKGHSGMALFIAGVPAFVVDGTAEHRYRFDTAK